MLHTHDILIHTWKYFLDLCAFDVCILFSFFSCSNEYTLQCIFLNLCLIQRLKQQPMNQNLGLAYTGIAARFKLCRFKTEHKMRARH